MGLVHVICNINSLSFLLCSVSVQGVFQITCIFFKSHKCSDITPLKASTVKASHSRWL